MSDRSIDRVVWAAAVPLCALALAVMWVITGLLIPETFAIDPGLFLEQAVHHCAPEPLEQGRYVLALGLTFALLWAVAAYARAHAGGAGPSAWDSQGARRAARAARWLLFADVVAAVVYQEAVVYRFLGAHLLEQGVWLAIIAVVAWRVAPAARSAPTPGQAPARAPTWFAGGAAWTLALVCTAWELLPSLLWRHRPAGCAGMSLAHLPFQLGEFAAVLDGRTPLVDFFPQYQTCLGYLLAPVFRLTGLNPMTFTAAMVALAAVALLTVFAAFVSFTGGGVKALVLYVPFLWVVFTPMLVGRLNGLEVRDNAFSYFAVGPLRYFGPCLTLGCLAWYLARPGRGRLVFLFFTAGLTAVNNLDFGVPALGAALVGVLLSTEEGPLPGWRTAARLGGGAAAGTGLAVAGFVGLTLARSGRLPDWRMATCFQRAFAVNGFRMLPLPPFGLHWVFFVTFMAAIARGLFDRSASMPRKGLLLFGGVFGSGVTAYYVGRSHPHVLVCTLLGWGFPFLLLAWLGWEDAVARFRAGGWSRALTLPLVVLTLGYVAVIARFEERPGLAAQIARLRSRQPSGYPEHPTWGEDHRLVGLIRAHADPGELVLVTAPYAHAVTREAGVHNVFPFVNGKSLILRSQLDVVAARLRGGGVRLAFGDSACEEVDLLLASQGFRRRARGGGSVWRREEGRPVPLCSWGDGFHTEETFGGHERRWAGSRGELIIRNADARPVRVRLRFHCTPARPEPAVLSLACGADALERPIGSGGAEVAFGCTVAPGRTPVTFRCSGRPLDAPGDPRRFVFQVFGFEASEQPVKE